MIRARAIPRRPLGRTGINVSVISLGGVGLGGIYGEVGDDEAVETVHRAVQAGINFIDTSPIYGDSERRIGLALEQLNAEDREGLVIGSKVGDECPPYSDNGGFSPFSAEGVKRSVDHSLSMLKVDKLDTVLLHDPTMHEMDEFLTPTIGGMHALVDLKQQGTVGHIGIGCVEHQQQQRMMQESSCDIVLTVNDYNLLRRDAAREIFPRVQQSGIGLMNAGVSYMGLLADTKRGWQGGFLQTLHQPKLVSIAESMELWLQEHYDGLPLRTVALAFGLRDERVACLPIGSRRPDEVDECVASLTAASIDCNEEFWARFEAEFDNVVKSLSRDDHWYYDKTTTEL
eukprot:g4990.t1